MTACDSVASQYSATTSQSIDHLFARVKRVMCAWNKNSSRTAVKHTHASSSCIQTTVSLYGQFSHFRSTGGGTVETAAPLHTYNPSSLASFKTRLVFPFWYRLTQVGLEKRPLNGCGSSSSSSRGLVVNFCKMK